jgi:hypothetical protein
LPYSTPRLGYADLRSRRGNRDAKYASSLLRFGASPYQVFEDEDDDEYEGDDEDGDGDEYEDD